jgi:tRNA-specific 2-thiouridylase
MGIRDYPCPAGGCLLTDPIFAERIRDLLDRDAELRDDDVKLLKMGRHFRLYSGAKAIVGRDKDENLRLGNHLKDGDHALEISGQPGPLTLVRGEVDESDLALAAAITSRYGKSGGRVPTTIVCRRVGVGSAVNIQVDAVDRERVRSLMIGAQDGDGNGGSKGRSNGGGNGAKHDVVGRSNTLSDGAHHS